MPTDIFIAHYLKALIVLTYMYSVLMNGCRLLWHDFGLNELYRGDGRTPSGGFEYIVPNVDNVKDLQDLKVLKLKPFE